LGEQYLRDGRIGLGFEHAAHVPGIVVDRTRRCEVVGDCGIGFTKEGAAAKLAVLNLCSDFVSH